MKHQYIERSSGEVVTEQLLGDRMVRLLYDRVREHNSALFRLVTSTWSSAVLAAVNFDRPLLDSTAFAAQCGIDLSDCLERPEYLTTARRIFERKIRYETCRPMPGDPAAVVSPADARVLVGSLHQHTLLQIKGCFFSLDELLGKQEWIRRFHSGDGAVFRLTPDKYHYNHTPVAGRVADHYGLDGCYHSCNPAAVVREVTPFSKNKRVVTIIDTDVEQGSRVGLVAMIEVVALMIGDIVQAYSRQGYADPLELQQDLFLEKGQPKSLYRPGSSTDILLFEPGRIRFCDDLLHNQQRCDVQSRFSQGFGRPLVETDIRVRSHLATRI